MRTKSKRRTQMNVAKIDLPCGHSLANSRREGSNTEVIWICGMCGYREARERCWATTRQGLRCIHSTFDGSRTCRDHFGWLDGAR